MLLLITVIETWEKCRYTHRILKFGNWICFSLPSQYIRIGGFQYHINLNPNIPPEEVRYYRFWWLLIPADLLEMHEFEFFTIATLILIKNEIIPLYP